jgi:serine protease Do
MAFADELRQTIRSAVSAAGPSTVSIGRHGRGTGVVWASGQVITNAHNLRDRTTQVTFADGRETQATVLGVDVDGDVAVLEVDTGDTTPLQWAEGAPEIGDVVVAISAGGRIQRVTAGTVSGTARRFRGPRGRRVTGSVEHTAPLARGSSGGPLLDASGKLVGLNTNRIGEGFYLALACDDELRARLGRLAQGETVRRATLGVALAPAHVAARLRQAVGLPPRDGLLVRSVEEGSAAAAAGIVEGDLLVRAGDRELRTADDLLDVLDASDESITLSIVRGVEELEVVVRFAAAESESESEAGTSGT